MLHIPAIQQGSLGDPTRPGVASEMWVSKTKPIVVVVVAAASFNVY